MAIQQCGISHEKSTQKEIKQNKKAQVPIKRSHNVLAIHCLSTPVCLKLSKWELTIVSRIGTKMFLFLPNDPTVQCMPTDKMHHRFGTCLDEQVKTELKLTMHCLLLQ